MIEVNAMMLDEPRYKISHVAAAANVEVVWDPPWAPNMMSEAAKLQLGML